MTRAIPIALLFLVSGCGALILETTWLRWFRLLFGATAPAVSATLVAFFLGHALGAAWAGSRSRRWQNPLRSWGLLEIAAAVAALWVPVGMAGGEALLARVYDAVHESSSTLSALRFLIAVVASLPASFFLGATFPAIGAALLRRAEDLGTGGVGLYGINTLGAAVGAGVAAFVLPDWIGVRGGYAVGVAMLAAVGVSVWLLSSIATEADPAPRREESAHEAPARPSGEGALLVLAGFSGFGALALQVLLVQAFAQVMNQSVYAFGAVLVTVLVSLAVGAAGVALANRTRIVEPSTLLGLSFVGAALFAVSFPVRLFGATQGLESLVGSGRPWPAYLVEFLAFGAILAGPLLLCVALAFPLLLSLAGRGRSDQTPGVSIGRLVTANTVGALLGALTTPHLLLPAANALVTPRFGPPRGSGLWIAFGLVALLFAVAALLVPQASPRARWRRDLVLGLGSMVVLLQFSPLGLPPVHVREGDRLLWAETTASGVVAVVQRGEHRLIRTDNHYVLGGSSESVHEERQGHLPLLLHPTARDVAFIGAATGISAGAITAHPVQSLTLVEIQPGVDRAARLFFRDANRRVYEDPRTRVAVDDARNFLRATAAQFDVVVADLFVPWRSGTGSLLSVEHFQNVREHLRDDGLFCQWLPLYQMTSEEFRIVTATFLDVFPQAALFRGDFFGKFPIVALIGYTGTVQSAEIVSHAAVRLAAEGERDRWLFDEAGVWSLYIGPLTLLAEELADVQRNRDDRPRVQYLAARSYRGGALGVAEPFVGSELAAFGERLRQLRDRVGDPLYPDLSPSAHRAMAGGSALQTAGAFYVAGKAEEASLAFQTASQLLHPHLISEASADPSAAELWSQ